MDVCTINCLDANTYALLWNFLIQDIIVLFFQNISLKDFECNTLIQVV